MNKNDLLVLALAGVAVFMLLKSSTARAIVAPKQPNMLDDIISRVGWDWRIDGSQQDQMLDAQEAGF